MKTVLKVLTALAAAAGIVYVIATYGDKLVAWAKKLLGKSECEAVEDAPAEEAVVEEAPVVEEPVVEEPVVEEEVPVEEVVVEEHEPVAEESDFEG